MDPNLLKKLENYTLPPDAVDLIRKTKITFLVGVAGAGKDTVINNLLITDKYHRIVSHTTRKPRANLGSMEQDGVDYHFIDFKTAETMLDGHAFIEAKVFSGNIYGTSVAEIKMSHDEGKIAITDLEVQGVAEYRAVADNVIPIFLLPLDFDTWQKRLLKRYAGKADPTELKIRLQTAKAELTEALNKDYFEFVINADLDKTVAVVDEIAHGNFSTKKNERAKTIARELLERLNP